MNFWRESLDKIRFKNVPISEILCFDSEMLNEPTVHAVWNYLRGKIISITPTNMKPEHLLCDGPFASLDSICVDQFKGEHPALGTGICIHMIEPD